MNRFLNISTEALVHNCQPLTAIQGKANAFTMGSSQPAVLQKIRKGLHPVPKLNAEMPNCRRMQLHCDKLDQLQMRIKGSQVSNDIPHMVLKVLGQRARQEMLDTYRLQIQLHLKFAPDLERCHHVAHLESGTTTGIYILIQASQSNIRYGKKNQDVPPQQTLSELAMH